MGHHGLPLQLHCDYGSNNHSELDEVLFTNLSDVFLAPQKKDDDNGIVIVSLSPHLGKTHMHHFFLVFGDFPWLWFPFVFPGFPMVFLWLLYMFGT